jgi:hypothetical protein
VDLEAAGEGEGAEGRVVAVEVGGKAHASQCIGCRAEPRGRGDHERFGRKAVKSRLTC